MQLAVEDFRRCEDFKTKIDSGKQDDFYPYLMAAIKRKQQGYRTAIRSRLTWQRDASTEG